MIDTIYICIEDLKVCYAVRTDEQVKVEHLYWQCIDKLKRLEGDKGFFLHDSMPEGFTLIMEIIPRRKGFDKDSPEDNTWQAVKTERLAALEELAKEVRDLPYGESAMLGREEIHPDGINKAIRRLKETEE